MALYKYYDAIDMCPRKDEAVKLWDCALALEMHPLCEDGSELMQKVEFLKSTAQKLQPKLLPPCEKVVRIASMMVLTALAFNPIREIVTGRASWFS